MSIPRLLNRFAVVVLPERPIGFAGIGWLMESSGDTGEHSVTGVWHRAGSYFCIVDSLIVVGTVRTVHRELAIVDATFVCVAIGSVLVERSVCPVDMPDGHSSIQCGHYLFVVIPCMGVFAVRASFASLRLAWVFHHKGAR